MPRGGANRPSPLNQPCAHVQICVKNAPQPRPSRPSAVFAGFPQHLCTPSGVSPTHTNRRNWLAHAPQSACRNCPMAVPARKPAVLFPNQGATQLLEAQNSLAQSRSMARPLPDLKAGTGNNAHPRNKTITFVLTMNEPVKTTVATPPPVKSMPTPSAPAAPATSAPAPAAKPVAPPPQTAQAPAPRPASTVPPASPAQPAAPSKPWKKR